MSPPLNCTLVPGGTSTVVSHASPAALLFQNGTMDELVPPAEALRYQDAGSEPKTMLWYEAGHDTSPAAADDTVAWLQEHGALCQHQASTGP